MDYVVFNYSAYKFGWKFKIKLDLNYLGLVNYDEDYY